MNIQLVLTNLLAALWWYKLEQLLLENKRTEQQNFGFDMQIGNKFQWKFFNCQAK